MPRPSPRPAPVTTTTWSAKRAVLDVRRPGSGWGCSRLVVLRSVPASADETAACQTSSRAARSGAADRARTRCAVGAAPPGRPATTARRRARRRGRRRARRARRPGRRRRRGRRCRPAAASGRRSSSVRRRRGSWRSRPRPPRRRRRRPRSGRRSPPAPPAPGARRRVPALMPVMVARAWSSHHGAPEPGERGDEDDPVAARPGGRRDLGRRPAEQRAQPGQRRAAGADVALERVRGLVQLPGDGPGDAGGGAGRAVGDGHDRRAGPVRDLDLPGPPAGVGEERGVAVAEDAGDGDVGGQRSEVPAADEGSGRGDHARAAPRRARRTARAA